MVEAGVASTAWPGGNVGGLIGRPRLRHHRRGFAAVVSCRTTAMIHRRAGGVKARSPGFSPTHGHKISTHCRRAPGARATWRTNWSTALGDRIRDGRLAPGDKLPTEAAIMAEHGVSRTVVREALSKLQAAGQVLTRHGIGTFVVGPADVGAVSHRARATGDAARRDRDARIAHRPGDRGRGAGRPAPQRSQPARDAARARRFRRRGAGRPRRGGGRLPLPPRDRARHPEPAFRRADGHARRVDDPARAARRAACR